MLIDIIHDDANSALLDLAQREELFDSCCCDPPYYLESIVKRFGKSQAAAKYGSDGRFTRLSGGFMGREWDGADEDGYRIAHDPRFWRKVLRLLKPGAFCMAFSSPRTGHRQALAMEEAGFVMHPFIAWVYGQGMPKGHALDKNDPKLDGFYQGVGTIKPAAEPIYVGQRPFSERTALLNYKKHGVGYYDIGKCLIPSETGEKPRWPANVIHDGSAEVVALFPEAGGQRGRVSASQRKNKNVFEESSDTGKHYAARHDKGSAARFFHCFPPMIYCPKAGKEDREGSEHPTVKPIALMRYLVRLVTPEGGRVLDPFAGSGTTGEAALREGCEATLIESEEDYVRFLRRRFRNADVL